MVGDSGDGCDIERFGGPDHVFDLVEVHGAVFAVDHHEVESDGSENLYYIGREAADDCAESNFALGKFGFGSVGSHCWYGSFLD